MQKYRLYIFLLTSLALLFVSFLFIGISAINLIPSQDTEYLLITQQQELNASYAAAKQIMLYGLFALLVSGLATIYSLYQIIHKAK